VKGTFCCQAVECSVSLRGEEGSAVFSCIEVGHDQINATMNTAFTKYHALGNDFLVIDAASKRLNRSALRQIAQRLCDRRTGVGADGILYVTPAHGVDCAVDIYNADGSWAEKSGNGLRIVAVHRHLASPSRKSFRISMGGAVSAVRVVKKVRGAYLVSAELGEPEFRASGVPVRTRNRCLVNSPIRIGGVRLPVTCLSIGNPHTVLVVDDFDFDWKALGREIEISPLFPRGTNVEFVKVASRKKLVVADWERGAGATGSSGTGAAASVVALVTLGKADRSCEVVFSTGSLFVNWRTQDSVVELTGPVQRVMSGQWAAR
jgi:diaminopimelate epimerase